MDSESVDWINRLRQEEMTLLFERLPWLAGDVLEIGGGSGQQAAVMAARGLRVQSIDIESSGYRQGRVFPVAEYDGRHIPFPDASFDIVFSSNALEHVKDLDALEAEMLRVLRPQGRAVHVLPTHRWRLWTSLAHYPGIAAMLWRGGAAAASDEHAAQQAPGRALRRLRNALAPSRHGERGNVATEYWYFHPRWWQAHFERNRWTLVESFDVGLFYTGYLVARGGLAMERRRRLAGTLGSATRCYVLAKAGTGLPATGRIA